jgi:hypothetical protein
MGNNDTVKYVPKKIFYQWVVENIEGATMSKDERGIYFVFEGDANAGHGNIDNFKYWTCDEFVRWFEENKNELLYDKLNCTALRDRFINEACDGSLSVWHNGESLQVSKIKFNSWLRVAAQMHDIHMAEARDKVGKWVFLSQ